MKKEITLNGERFTFVKGSGAPYRKAWMVEDCYGRCSDTKREIWKDWLRWAYDLGRQDGINSVDLWISSSNCMMFTIGGEITYTTGEVQYIYITKTRHEIW